MGEPTRLLCWFSCGATSAVAIKLALEKYRNILPARIVYCDTGSEHPDNARFIRDCEAWYGQPIDVLKSSRYKDIWDVFKKERYLVGPRGARCTTEMKKMVRRDVEDLVGDLQVFGFDASEKARIKRFKENNPEVKLATPLVDAGMSKIDCLLMIEQAGIEVPLMYRLGFQNNNCIGCVKGGMGYWNKIRRVFPEVFERMSAVEQELGVAIVKYKGKRTFLKDIPPDAGRNGPEFPIKCGLVCGE